MNILIIGGGLRGCAAARAAARRGAQVTMLESRQHAAYRSDPRGLCGKGSFCRPQSLYLLRIAADRHSGGYVLNLQAVWAAYASANDAHCHLHALWTKYHRLPQADRRGLPSQRPAHPHLPYHRFANAAVLAFLAYPITKVRVLQHALLLLKLPTF